MKKSLILLIITLISCNKEVTSEKKETILETLIFSHKIDKIMAPFSKITDNHIQDTLKLHYGDMILRLSLKSNNEDTLKDIVFANDESADINISFVMNKKSNELTDLKIKAIYNRDSLYEYGIIFPTFGWKDAPNMKILGTSPEKSSAIFKIPNNHKKNIF